MRIKIIGENNCARATRHLLRLAGFAVTEYLPADAVIQGPAAGYAITIDLAGGRAADRVAYFAGDRAHERTADSPLDGSADSSRDSSTGASTKLATEIPTDLSPAAVSPNSLLGPDCATQQYAPSMSESAVAENLATAGLPSFLSAGPSSSPAGNYAFEQETPGRPFLVEHSRDELSNVQAEISGANDAAGTPRESTANAGASAKTAAQAGGELAGYIHFDSVDSALETAVLRHVAQLAAGPVILDQPGGVVRSERELRIVAPCSGDARADEAAAVAIEFGVLRGLLDLVAPDAREATRWNGAGKKLLGGDADGETGAGNTVKSRSKKFWWPFAVVALGTALGGWSAMRAGAASDRGVFADGYGVNDGSSSGLQRLKPGLGFGGYVVAEATTHKDFAGGTQAPSALTHLASPPRELAADGITEGQMLPLISIQGKKPVLLEGAALGAGVLAAQGQFATGQGVRITDGNNFLVVDPCQGQTKLYASINQTANTQLVAGSVSKKIYVCSIHVVAAAATNVAVVEGTGSVCATGTAGVSGFGGATAATGWNFAGNGGIALGSGESSLGAEGTSGDNLCIFNSGSGQVSGGISYVVE